MWLYFYLSTTSYQFVVLVFVHLTAFACITLLYVVKSETANDLVSDSPEVCIDFSDGAVLFLDSILSVVLALWRLWVYVYVALMQELFTVNIMGHEDCTGSMVEL